MNGNAPSEPSPRAVPPAGQGSPSPQTPGSRYACPAIPGHELLVRIGGGGYGEVWLAKTAVGTLRAVKVVYRRTFDRAEHFEREFKGLQKFEPISRSHEGFVDILQLGRNDPAGYFYYVMEVADAAAKNANDECQSPKETRNPNEQRNVGRSGVRTSGFGIPSSFDIGHSEFYAPRTLRHDLRDRGLLPLADCLSIGLKLASALDHLHKAGLVHRDIKPSNIIFVNGEPKLADIGLVTTIEEAHSMVGTAGYIPPEGPGTSQADIYSLGKVLYEAAFGKDRQEFPQLPPDLQSRPEHAGLLELNEVIVKACTSEVSQRYKSAEAVHTDLALLLRGQSVRRLHMVERRLAFLSRVSLVVAGLLVIAAIAYLFAASQTRRAERARTIAEQLLYAADMSLAQQALAAGNLSRATALLEAHRPGYKSEIRNPKSEIEQDLRGFEWYYLKSLCHGDETYTFRGHAEAVRGVAVSPDGKLLASSSDDGTIKLWDLNAKSNLATLKGHHGPVNAIAFSPDGTALASGGADQTA